MKMKSILGLASASSIVLALLTGCGSGDSASPKTDSSTPKSGSSVTIPVDGAAGVEKTTAPVGQDFFKKFGLTSELAHASKYPMSNTAQYTADIKTVKEMSKFIGIQRIVVAQNREKPKGLSAQNALYDNVILNVSGSYTCKDFLTDYKQNGDFYTQEMMFEAGKGAGVYTRTCEQAEKKITKTDNESPGKTLVILSVFKPA